MPVGHRSRDTRRHLHVSDVQRRDSAGNINAGIVTDTARVCGRD